MTSSGNILGMTGSAVETEVKITALITTNAPVGARNDLQSSKG